MMTDPPTTVIIDSDALIALFNPHDAHAAEALSILEHFQARDVTLRYPATMLVETITTFQRKLTSPDQARLLIQALQTEPLLIEPVDQSVLFEAATYLQAGGSKKNTMFDAVVAALATRYGALVFSFDRWYEKLGLTLARDAI